MSTLRAAINHPWTAFRSLKAKVTRPFIVPPEDRTNILNEDWDNLIILDACRYDTFEKYNIIEGDLNKIFSTASHTAEFVEENIDREFLDTAYVSASPQLVGTENKFHHVAHLWRDDWDEDLRTVLPEVVTSRVKEIQEEYPNKRLVAHYMQPHYPFIGDLRSEIGTHATFTGGDVTNRDHPSVWDLLVSRKVDRETVMRAYEENLRVTLPHVQELISSLNGKTVISSDHGNLFRKKVSRLPIRIEGHPPRYPDPDLLAVPWLKCPYDTRKEITAAEDKRKEGTVDGEEVAQRLKDLGYLS